MQGLWRGCVLALCGRGCLAAHALDALDDERHEPQEDGDDAERGCDRAREERERIPFGLDHRLHEGVLEHVAEHQAQHCRGNRDAMGDHEVGRNAEAQHAGDIERAVVDGVGADHAEAQDHRVQDGRRHAQHLGGAADHDVAKRDEQDVGEQEHHVDGVEEVAVLGKQRRSRLQALHEQHADDDRGERVARDAEHQGRDEGAGDGGVVCGGAVGDRLDAALAVLLRMLGEALAHAVADPRGDVAAGAREHAHQGADDLRAQELELELADDTANALEDPGRVGDHLGVLSLLCRDVLEDLGQAEHADHGGDEGEAFQKLHAAEGEPREAQRDVCAHAGKQQSDEQRDEALEHRAA